MSVDMCGIANSPDSITAEIPAPPQPDMRNQFRMDASTSRLFFKLVGRNKAVGEFTVYIESDRPIYSCGASRSDALGVPSVMLLQHLLLSTSKAPRVRFLP